TLRRLAPNLRHAGIVVEFVRTETRRLIAITQEKKAKTASSASAASGPSNSLENKAFSDDGPDANLSQPDARLRQAGADLTQADAGLTQSEEPSSGPKLQRSKALGK